MRFKIKFYTFILGIVCVAAIVFGFKRIDFNSINSFNSNVTDEYQYPLTPASEGWSDLTSEECLQMVDIPLSIASGMTTEGLLKSLVHNPRISVIYIGMGSMYEEIDKFCVHVPALRELLSREDALFVTAKYLSNPDLTQHEYNIAIAFFDYLYQDDFTDSLSYSDPVWTYIISTVYTPDGSNV